MSQYFGQNSTNNNLTGEVWSQGSHSYSSDGCLLYTSDAADE